MTVCSATLEKELDDCATLSSRKEFINEYNFLLWFYYRIKDLKPMMVEAVKDHYSNDTGDCVPDEFREGDG